MANRFSDVNRGGELKFALDNYTAYKSDVTTRQTKRMKGGSVTNRPKQTVSIFPFSEAPNTAKNETTYVRFLVKMQKPGGATTTGTNWAASELNKYFDATPEGAGGAIDAPKGFRAARASVFDPTSQDATYVSSKFTKLNYIKRPGVGFHTPIGRLAASPANDEVTVKRNIKVAVLTALNAENYRRISFSDERAASV